MVKTINKLGKAKQVLYAILAALLCFVGPTYFVAVVSKAIPTSYAMTLGFVSFLIGVIFAIKLVEE